MLTLLLDTLSKLNFGAVLRGFVFDTDFDGKRSRK
jgi:hypothetical protein